MAEEHITAAIPYLDETGLEHLVSNSKIALTHSHDLARRAAQLGKIHIVRSLYVSEPYETKRIFALIVLPAIIEYVLPPQTTTFNHHARMKILHTDPDLETYDRQGLSII